MIFKCKNCGANSIYSPEKGTMFCPYCDSVDSDEPAAGEGMNFCINCGGELNPGDYMSAVKCEHCGSYIIFEERTQGDYEPHLILPFKISKKQVQERMKAEFGKKPFIPSDFLSEGKMSAMEGMYVPYFMYDFDCRYLFHGTGHKVRKWRSGNTEYTETSIFDVQRDMSVTFDKIPVDSSIAMPDDTMDLLEPFDYNALEKFQSKYMSGFLAEKYNMSAAELEPRAKEKAGKDAKSLMDKTMTEYVTVERKQDNISLDTTADYYTLLPVWNYEYTYNGKVYPLKINGQTGKISGKVPISVPKAIAYTATVFLSVTAIGNLLNLIMGVF